MAKPYSGSYFTHLGALIACVNKTDGDILELGIGLGSTPYLHYACTIGKRNLLSLENDPGWLKTFKTSDFMHFLYENKYHKLELVDVYEESPLIDKQWDVVLVDQTPDDSRKETIKKLANKAKYIIAHDSNERHEKNYHYSEIYPLFKHKRVWDKDDRHATVLSNFQGLEDLWE
ncbi:MAG: hypothetical protein NUV69_00570 [Candidatus Curtissbacteria bacterium]|nr:hypothetical protein [Candidatus Curtissbacteria bacterium]